MKIILTKPMLRNGVMLDPGASIDLPDRQADFFVQGGWAKAAEQPAPPLPEPEKATTKRRSN